MLRFRSLTISRRKGRIRLLVGLGLIAAVGLSTRPVSASPALVFTVTSTADVHDASPGDGICATSPASAAGGACTLRAAAEEAAVQPAGTPVTIDLPAGTYQLPLGTVTLASSTIVLAGAGSGSTTIQNTRANNRVIHNTTNATIQDVTITGGVAPAGGDGGGIFSSGPLALTRAVLDGNTATHPSGTTGGLGGGMYEAPAWAVSISNSTFRNNTAIQGGGLYADGGSFALTRDTFAGNSALGQASPRISPEGGALFDNADSMTVTDSGFTGNGVPLVGSPPANTTPEGGAIFIQTGTSILGGTIAGNRAPGDNSQGGGIFANFSLTMQGTTVSGNVAGRKGGGIDSEDYASLTGVSVRGNTVGTATKAGEGGGIYIDFHSAVSNSVFQFNRAIGGTVGSPSQGGGMYVNDDVTFTRVRILQNRADDGGGFYDNRDSLTFQDSFILTNTAGHDGGGIYENNNSTDTTANIILNRTVAINNFAGHDGGGFFSFTDPAFAVILNQGAAIVGNHAGNVCNNIAPC